MAGNAAHPHRTLRHLLLQEISDVIITKMTRSKVFLHQVPLPYFFTTAKEKKWSWELDILSWSQLTIKQAKSPSSPFFSEAIYPPKLMFAVQPSSGLVLTFPLHQMQQ